MARIKDDYRGLTGMQKAGIFMLAVGNAHSAQLFEKMDDEEIRDLFGAMSSLGTINAGIIERLFVDRVRRSAELGRRLGRSVGSTERLLMSALPEERVSQIMEEMRGPAGRTMWDKLGNVNEAVLANYLKN